MGRDCTVLSPVDLSVDPEETDSFFQHQRVVQKPWQGRIVPTAPTHGHRLWLFGAISCNVFGDRSRDPPPD